MFSCACLSALCINNHLRDVGASSNIHAAKMNASVWTVYSAGNQFPLKVTFPFFRCCFLTPLFSEALGKMKDVYEKNPQMGDPASLASQISQTSQNIERLRGELSKYEVICTSVFIHAKRLSLLFVLPATLKSIYKPCKWASAALWCPFLLRMQVWLAEAGGRGETLRYKTHTFNNNGAHDIHR